MSQGPADAAEWWEGKDYEHFQLHGHTLPGVRFVADYDNSARETIRLGIAFSYTDLEYNVPRIGYFARGSNRFTALNRWETKIMTHFIPDDGENYVFNLPDSTYTR